MPAPRSDPRSTPTESTAANALAAALADASAPDVASAYLFGSIAEHRAHRESDIDLGVLFARKSHPTRAARFDAGILLAGRLQGALGLTVDLVVLNDAPPLLGRHVVVRGHRIHCRDAAADHAFVRDVQLRAADLEPWLRRMRELKLRVLRG